MRNGTFRADGVTSSVPLWVKAIPVVTLGAGIFIAYKKGGGLRYFSYGAMGALVGGAFIFIASGKNVSNILTKFGEKIQDQDLDKEGKIKYIMDNTYVEGGDANKEALKLYLSTLSDEDINLSYKVRQYIKATAGIPMTQKEGEDAMYAYGIKDKDMGDFMNRIYTEMQKYGVREK